MVIYILIIYVWSKDKKKTDFMFNILVESKNVKILRLHGIDGGYIFSGIDRGHLFSIRPWIDRGYIYVQRLNVHFLCWD